MINDFLRKYQEELISSKIEIKEELDFLETKIREENKFLSLLEDTNDSYFTDFSPRDLNVKNKEKADEVRKLLEDLQSDQKEKLAKLKFFESRLLEISSLLSNNSSNLILNSSNSISEIQKSSNNIIEGSTDSNDEILKKKLFEVKKTILLDPYRASILLDSIIKDL